MQVHLNSITMPNLNEESIAAWASLISASRYLMEEVEAALKAADLPPLSWYDVLLEVENSGVEGIRPFELVELLLLPQYGTSRLINRIVQEGYLKKSTSGIQDGRGFAVSITERGKKIRREMWPIYSKRVNELLGSDFSAAELRSLHKICNKITSKHHS